VGKIIEALHEALAYVRGDCGHEFTVWMPEGYVDGYPTRWSHECTRCHVKITVFEQPDER